MQLDSNSAEAHTSLAVFKLWFEFDWDGCEREFRRAIALNPNYAFAHDQFGMALAFTGRFDESIEESRRAAQLDPLSPQVLVDAAMAPMFQKNFAAAKVLAQKGGGARPDVLLSRHGGGLDQIWMPASSARPSRSSRRPPRWTRRPS